MIPPVLLYVYMYSRTIVLMYTSIFVCNHTCTHVWTYGYTRPKRSIEADILWFLFNHGDKDVVHTCVRQGNRSPAQKILAVNSSLTTQKELVTELYPRTCSTGNVFTVMRFPRVVSSLSFFRIDYHVVSKSIRYIVIRVTLMIVNPIESSI